jgi:hypothetical protein
MINADQRVRDTTEKAAHIARQAATPPGLEDPSRTWVVIERVEVPVPVDDTAAEMVQMQPAAAAVIAIAVTKARIRRRYDRHAVSAVIDITDPRILDRPPDDATRTKETVS